MTDHPRMSPQSREYRLLGIIQEHAPSGAWQQKIADLVHEMEEQNLAGSQIETNLAGILFAGLVHGNWPWPEGGV